LGLEHNWSGQFRNRQHLRL